MICAFCEAVDPPAWEYCPERDGKSHRMVAELRQASALGVSGERRRPVKGSRSGFTPASTGQRAKNRDARCVVCAEGPADPAHLIPRSALEAGQDDLRATIPLCRRHHRDYDSLRLDLLPFEAAFRVELAFAVERYGLLPTLQRVSNTRWEAAA